MHDYLHVIEHYPLARRKSVDRDWPQAVIGFELPLDFACNGLQVRFRRAGANYEKIGKSRDPLEIEDDNLLRLFIRREVSAGPG